MLLIIVHNPIHADNRKNDFLKQGKGSNSGINERFHSSQKKFGINFSEANTNFCLSLYYNGDNIYLFVNEKETFRFKADNKSVNFPTQFRLGIYLMDFVLPSLEKYL